MGRAPCCDKMGLKKGPWTAEEDQVLIDFIRENGHGNWRALPKQAGLLRCGKSCRLRWTNYLRPDIKRGNFSVQEEETIIKLHEILGNRWSTIASRLPGRTDNEIKNVWNTYLKKRLLRMGIDPVTHRATLPLSSVAHRNGENLDSFKCAASAIREGDATLYNSSTSIYTNAEFGGQPAGGVNPKMSPINSPRRHPSNFSDSLDDASHTEHFSSSGSIDNEASSTVDSSSISGPAKENEELNTCLNSVDMEGIACNQVDPSSVENELNSEEFFINDAFWPPLSYVSNEIPRFHEKSNQISKLQPSVYKSVNGEDDYMFRELENNMVDACTSANTHNQQWIMQLQQNDDCINFWLNMLGQVGPLPKLYEHLAPIYQS